MRNSVFIAFVAVLLLVGLISLFIAGNKGQSVELPLTPLDGQQIATSTVEAPVVLPYGEATIAIGETASFPDVRITALSIDEDSRCPLDVQCIQAGTVRVLLETVSGLGTSTDVLALGDFLTTEAEVITFLSVQPQKRSTQSIFEETYRLSFKVEKRSASEVDPPAMPRSDIVSKPAACYVGGCSSQLCTDDPDIASTCEYREEYACYQKSHCERQQNGECGWTQTAELLMCLASSQ